MPLPDAPAGPLLTSDEPHPALVQRASGASVFVLVGDHAGNRIPVALNELGLPPEERLRHIGWDIGVAGLGRLLSDRLDAPFVEQRYSRLVIDSNRAPGRMDAIPPVSDGTTVPGNAAIDEIERARRTQAIHTPYHDTIAALIAQRDAAGQPTVLISLHSFTPRLRTGDHGDHARPWHCGMLHEGGKTAFSMALLHALRDEGDLIVGDNEPYAMGDTDFTVPTHARSAGRHYAEIEVRQDLIADAAGQAAWAARLARLLPACWDKVQGS